MYNDVSDGTPLSGTIYVSKLDKSLSSPTEELLLTDTDALVITVGGDYKVYLGDDQLGGSVVVLSKVDPPKEFFTGDAA